ncbi:ABC transporter ATP-binding protein [Treponema parvum]|uniref:ABC transporter ATP-binding protein n=1 Tax=Treponema parvum TaxID=138851 RepID=A0A975F031_9SPIR|nr:ABC transporter ATP-binding protein [Treponema parvum]QTQ12086.1 ABC transporter ATP-binding protein [Treponema parvum]QTQ15938.1 ABC transporter ATP-binding protein [Treponema parvum]
MDYIDPDKKNLIEMLGITKAFPGVVANDNITLTVQENEVLALLGENGAGKSTLMSILFGSYEPDFGVIKIRGKTVKIDDPNVATALGIGMVHQHFKLVHNYTVAENIVLGFEPKKKFGLLDLNSAEKKVSELSEKYGLKVDPKDKIEDITVGMQQRVEILKVLYRSADIIIFDEPTAVLTPQEIDDLILIIKRLKAEGKTIIIITHKLQEIKAVAERCTVLRRGKVISTVKVSDVSEQDLAEMMVGRAVKFKIEKKPPKFGDVKLLLDKICVKNSRGQIAVRDLSLDVRAGEIVGVAGVDGNGQSELLFGITGMAPLTGGKIYINGVDVSKYSIRKRIEAGLGYIPEDRQKHALIADFSLAENIAIKNYYLPPYTKNGCVLVEDEMKNKAESLIEAFDIRAAQGADTKAGSMSGGNQQKAIVAREVDMGGGVLVIAQPTRGLDVGAIEYIHNRIIEERDKGRAILLISFELDEIMNLCDRIATISKGMIAGIFNAGEVTEREIGIMMAGSKDKHSERIA